MEPSDHKNVVVEEMLNDHIVICICAMATSISRMKKFNAVGQICNGHTNFKFQVCWTKAQHKLQNENSSVGMAKE